MIEEVGINALGLSSDSQLPRLIIELAGAGTVDGRSTQVGEER